MGKMSRHEYVLTITGLGILTAMVIALQYLGGFIRFGQFSISLVLIPIVIGAALYGPFAGAYLGLVFAVAVFITGDANTFMALNPFGTIVTVILKGMLAGFLAGLFYRLIEKKSSVVATIVAAVVCPVVNTTVFLIGCRLFFYETVASWGASSGFTNTFVYMMVGFVGLNFLFELLTNVILSPVIVRIITLIRKRGQLTK